MHRQIAGRLTGRVTKWIVLGAWLVALVGLGSFSGQAGRGPEQRGVVLAPVQRRVDPGAGEAHAVPGPQRHPHRRGLRARLGPHRRGPRRCAGPGRGDPGDGRRCRARSVGPIPSTDGEAAQTVVTFNFGKNGWNDMPDTADTLRDLAAIDGVDVYVAGVGWPGRRLVRGVRRHRRHPAARRARRGDPDPAVHLPQSRALDPADLLGVVSLGCSLGLVYLLAKYADLTVNGQSQAILTHPRDRRRHRLRAAAGGALPRGAAPPRRPARGDGLRPAPRGAGHPGQRGHGRGRHAVPALRRDELHRRARPGGRDRHRR